MVSIDPQIFVRNSGLVVIDGGLIYRHIDAANYPRDVCIFQPAGAIKRASERANEDCSGVVLCCVEKESFRNYGERPC